MHLMISSKRRQLFCLISLTRKVFTYMHVQCIIRQASGEVYVSSIFNCFGSSVYFAFASLFTNRPSPRQIELDQFSLGKSVSVLPISNLTLTLILLINCFLSNFAPIARFPHVSVNLTAFLQTLFYQECKHFARSFIIRRDNYHFGLSFQES